MTDDFKDKLSEVAADVAARVLEHATRRAYVKPAILTESLFNASAGCGKTNPFQFSCQRLPRGS